MKTPRRLRPYAGSSGAWTESDTSVAAAAWADETGVTVDREAATRAGLEHAGVHGYTSKEYVRDEGEEHGDVRAISGAFVRGRELGVIRMLQEKRGKPEAHVHVLDKYLNNRPYIEYVPKPPLHTALAHIERLLRKNNRLAVLAYIAEIRRPPKIIYPNVIPIQRASASQQPTQRRKRLVRVPG